MGLFIMISNYSGLRELAGAFPSCLYSGKRISDWRETVGENDSECGPRRVLSKKGRSIDGPENELD